MKQKVECHRPNCKHVCYLEILKLRQKQHSNKHAQNKHNHDNDRTDKIITEKEPGNINTKEVTTPSPTVAIPELILELIDLCNFLNNSKLLKFEKLNSFCRMKNVNLEDFLNHVHYKGNKNYGLEKNNTKIILEEEIDSTDPMSYEETFSEKTISSVIQTVVGCHTNEYEPEAITETKRVENTGILFNKETSKVKQQDVYRYQSTPLISFSKFRDNEISYTDLISTTKIGTELDTGCFVGSMFSFNKPFQTVNLRPSVTENIMTYDACYCDDENKDQTIQTSSIISKVDHAKEIKDKCCCDCDKKNKFGSKVDFKGKKKLTEFLQVLFHGPRPTFAYNTKCVNLEIEKMLQSNFPSTTPMAMHSAAMSFTVLKAVKPSEVMSVVRSYNANESVKHYVDYIDDKCASMYKSYKQAQWEYETNINHDTRQKSMASSLQFNHFLRAVTNELSIFKKTNLNDMKLRRQIKLLALPGMDTLSEIKSNEFQQILYAMEAIYSSAMVGKYNLQSQKIALNPDIINIMAHSVDPNEQKYYWLEWRKATGKHIRSLFEHYISLMQLAAKTNGFHDASEMWTRQYESDDFVDILSIYWEGVKPLYLQLHAYVRHKLHGLYGDVAGANDCGKIPAHLTGDIWSKNWKNLYSKVKPYKINDYMDQPLKKKMTPQRITRDVENLFVCMGFSKLPNKFWDNSIFTKGKHKLILCEPSAWDMGDGLDYRIKLCATPKMEDLFNIHNLVALIEYYKEYQGLPYAFRNAANPGFSEAIGETIVLSAQTKDHLNFFGIQSKQSEKADINKLLRIALEKVAFIPYSYILVLWRHKVFMGEINVTNYNSEWWKLRSEYQGICPPVKRTEDDFDVGCKQHIIANQPYIKYFLSTILQFQFYEALCKQSGFQGPLHKCNIIGSEKAGKTLRDAMSMGSSRHWKDVLEVLTGTRKIESRPLMRYFEPLMAWLQRENKEKKTQLGWDK
ncbi:unnamed protein product [Nezara viridula]|nr:unnamed protein product [Nezara viridula]